MIIDDVGVVLAALLTGFLFWAKFYFVRFQSSQVDFSSVQDFMKPSSLTLRKRFANLPRILLIVSFILMLIALIDPHEFILKKPQRTAKPLPPTEGRVLMLVVDQSSSMNEPAFEGRSRRETLSKIQFIKPILEKFVNERSSDLIGLSSFARVVKIISPPTLDHAQIIKDLFALTPVSGIEQDGTAIGYAILKTTHLITSLKEQTKLLGQRAPYTIQGAALVIVTDGLQDPNPLDKDNSSRSMGVEDAASFATEKNIRLYIINIEPKLSEAKYLPNLKQMRKVAEVSGGKFFQATSSEELSEFVEAINRIETSKIRPSSPQSHPAQYDRYSYFPFFIGLALTFCLIASFLSLTYLRKIS